MYNMTKNLETDKMTKLGTLIAFRAGELTKDQIRFLMDNFKGVDFKSQSDMIRFAIECLAIRYNWQPTERVTDDRK